MAKSGRKGRPLPRLPRPALHGLNDPKPLCIAKEPNGPADYVRPLHRALTPGRWDRYDGRHEDGTTTIRQGGACWLVERVTCQNAENGFCVIRVKARGHRDLVTVVGHAAAISAGEWIAASGDWTNDRTHGQQFEARFLKTSAPTSLDGIEKYLASGGIGPVYAKKCSTS